MTAVQQRRLAAAAAIALAVAVLVMLVSALTGGDDDSPDAPAARAAAETPVELPRGGRRLLPGHTLVGFYGAPQDDELGALGIGSPDAAARRLERIAQRYRVLGRPVLPVMELIAVIANAHPGDDGLYMARQDDSVIRRYLRAARRAKMLLVLDIQPGRSDFFSQVLGLEKWLREPDVSLALDPEWHTPNAVPGDVIGSVDVREVNAVSFWLDELVRKHDLPQKLLLVHRFTDGMISDDQALKRRENVAVTVNVDGFGSQVVKKAKYQDFVRRTRSLHKGFKLFFKEDVRLFQPAQLKRFRPVPDVVVYE